VAAQNGLDRADALRPLLPAGEVIPALLYIGAERVAPGRVVHHAGNRVVVPVGPDGQRVVEVLAGSPLEVRQSSDFATAAWRKLLGNVVANPITALTMRRTDVLREPAIAELARGLLREAADVARADGAALADDEVERVMDGTAAYGRRTGSSMLYDRLAERPVEWEAITGEVVERAKRHGLDAPLNRAILALLQALNPGTS
jgi:2-dehydropantoate 2-reductase